MIWAERDDKMELIIDREQYRDSKSTLQFNSSRNDDVFSMKRINVIQKKMTMSKVAENAGASLKKYWLSFWVSLPLYSE
jgi:hypothetical protein